MRNEAFSLIERNIATSVESDRKTRFTTLAALGQDTFGGLAGRIGLETFAAYSLPETRVKSYINQAYQQAIDQYNFIIRREDKERIALTFSTLTGDLQKFDPLVPYCIPVEPIRLLVLSLLMLDAGQDGTALKTQSFDLIERNVVAAVERDRKEVFQTLAAPENQNTFAGLVGRVGLETLKAYSMPPARVASYVNQAAAIAVDHYNFITRREENELPRMEWMPRLTPDDESEIAHPLVTTEVLRTLAVSLIILDAGQDSSALKTQAFDLIERNVVAAVESARSVVQGEVGRLHNELTTGLKVPTARMTKLLNQAVSEVISHQNFIARSDDDDIPTPPATYEQKRLLVESYLVALAGNAEAALGLKKAALDLVERDIAANDETYRRTLRMELSLGAPNSFGYYWGRIGLGFDGALTFSNNAIKRAVTSAEESLMNSGKWVGTIGEYTMTLSNSGDVYLPREVETVLFATFDGDPRPVHDRFAEYMRGGTGIKTTEEPWRSGFSDRGDGVEVCAEDPITLPGNWGFNTSVGMGCPTKCSDLMALWQSGLVGWGNAICGSGGTGERFIVKNTSGCKSLEITITSRPNHTVTLQDFEIDGHLVTGGSATGGSFTFTIPPSCNTLTDITNKFSDEYSCVCSNPDSQGSCRSGWVALPPTYRYVGTPEVKRRYFVSVPQENKQTLVRYLAKRRFVPHLADTDSMYLNNYEAVSQAALAILTQGKVGSFDAARKLLADQMTQQYFKSQISGAHNRSILAMR